MEDPLYRDRIMQHYQYPKHYGLEEGFDIETTLENPMCGDAITVRLKTDGSTVHDVSFESSGCVISRAGASLTAECISGGAVDAVRVMDVNDVVALLGGMITPMRLKCATLFLDAVKKVI